MPTGPFRPGNSPLTMIPPLLAALLVACAGTQARAASILIVCIGADNTLGRGIGKQHPGGVNSEEAFPAQLEKKLRAQGIDAHVVNAGRARSTTEGILDRLDSDVPDGTRLVILDRVKGNDTQRGDVDTKKFIAEIERRLEARQIQLIRLPGFGRAFAVYRDPDGRHYTAEGHEHIAEFLLPQVLQRLGN